MFNGKSLTCGDINLTAACMALGVPLNQTEPCSSVRCESRNRKYTRFHLERCTIKGDWATDILFQYWKSPGLCKSDSLKYIMDFIAWGKKHNIRKGVMYFEAIGQYLKECGHKIKALPGSLDFIDQFVSKNPDLKESYLCAFISNRILCEGLIKESPRKYFLKHGDNCAIIDDKLGKEKTYKLLGKLEHN